MKVSTKGRYALRVMLDLAEHNNGDLVKLKDIANRQDLSEKYLEQIIAILNRAGFLMAVRGSQGGYKLTEAPKNITVGMILRLTEGSLAPVSCVEGDPSCEKTDSCITIYVWKKLADAINDVVDNITLQDLLDRQSEQREILNFSI